jgi:hypothetical protein
MPHAEVTRAYVENHKQHINTLAKFINFLKIKAGVIHNNHSGQAAKGQSPK